jgi:hypothetical protein
MKECAANGSRVQRAELPLANWFAPPAASTALNHQPLKLGIDWYPQALPL